MRLHLILISLALSSCGYLNVPVLSPYKMDIRQGNYVTQEMRDRLKSGMTKAQVRYVMGTPMINDAFHGNRWDYAYRLAQRGELVERQHLALYFEGDHLVRAEEDGKPVALLQPVVVPEAAKPATVAEPLAAQPVAQEDPSAAVLGSVQAWAAAWSSRNVRDYLAAYAPAYKPHGMSREAWETQRLDRISRPKTIEVALGDIRVVMQDGSHAAVTFRQDYRSDRYRDSMRKLLKLEKAGGTWLIVDEQAEK